MFSTQTWLREMEETEWNPSHASRAREKGAEGNRFLSLYQKRFLKMFWRALGSRRARRIFRLFISLQTGSNQHLSSQGR